MPSTAEVVAETQRLLRNAKDSAEGQRVLGVLPQGAGSGLDADTVDGLHASEIGKFSPDRVDELEVEALTLIIEHLKKIRYR